LEKTINFYSAIELTECSRWNFLRWYFDFLSFSRKLYH